MTPRTATIVRTHTILVLLAGSTLMSTLGCQAARERREARAEAKRQKQTQTEWMNDQSINQSSNQTSKQGGTPTQPTRDTQDDSPMVYEEVGPKPTRVIDTRPTRQARTPSSVDLIEPKTNPRFKPKNREERSFASAVEFRTNGDLVAALAELERAIAINPRFTRAFVEAGDIYMEMAKFDLAERQYAAAVRAEPRNFIAQYRHAVVLHQIGQLDESKRAYLRALSIRPADFNANLGVSIVQLEMGKAEQALPYAQRAVRNDGTSGQARLQLANVLAALDQHADAVIEYQQAAELIDAPTAGLLLNMSESLNQLNRYAEMVGALEQLVRIKPTAIAYERLGSGQFRLKSYDESLAAFKTASDYDDKHYPALNGIAVCELNNYLWSGKADGPARERAIAAMRSSLRIERKQPKIVELLRRYSKPSSQEIAGS
ncbi:MAG: tetratricopeptide repeat protein [Phycisphaerales bacterium]|nr:tetratricopeptide repeat protein [Phycisphaerales bacterium]